MRLVPPSGKITTDSLSGPGYFADSRLNLGNISISSGCAQNVTKLVDLMTSAMKWCHGRTKPCRSSCHATSLLIITPVHLLTVVDFKNGGTKQIFQAFSYGAIMVVHGKWLFIVPCGAHRFSVGATTLFSSIVMILGGVLVNSNVSKGNGVFLLDSGDYNTPYPVRLTYHFFFFFFFLLTLYESRFLGIRVYISEEAESCTICKCGMSHWYPIWPFFFFLGQNRSFSGWLGLADYCWWFCGR